MDHFGKLIDIQQVKVMFHTSRGPYYALADINIEVRKGHSFSWLGTLDAAGRPC